MDSWCGALDIIQMQPYVSAAVRLLLVLAPFTSYEGAQVAEGSVMFVFTSD